MPKRALANHRPYLLASILAGVSYFFVMDAPLGGLWLMLWKGAGVAFLAMYAAHRGKGLDGALIAAAMALCAAGDIALELSMVVGGALFAAGHLVSMVLYARNRRSLATPSQKLAGIALVLFPPLVAGLMAYPHADWMQAAGYSLIVGGMAGMAWISRFPRYRVGVGAVLFVVSDLAIFARESATIPASLAEWIIWPLYFIGQLMIATGVVQTLRKELPEAD